MQALSLITPRSRNDEANLQSHRDGRVTGCSLVGTILAGRYKILETIDADSFKAHDFHLNQPVTVRQALLTSQRASDVWRQKVQQLALVQDGNFLNVLDVIMYKASDFVVTERPRGQSIADLLREQSRLDLEDVLRLVARLAGALDIAAARFQSPLTGCSPTRCVCLQRIPKNGRSPIGLHFSSTGRLGTCKTQEE